MQLIMEILISAFILLGAVFSLVGALGLLRLPDLMMRLHAPTKVTTLGLGGVLAASVVYAFLQRGEISLHEILISVFLFMTAPVTALFIAKAHLHLNRKLTRDLPVLSNNSGWSTFVSPQVDAATGEIRVKERSVELPQRAPLQTVLSSVESSSEPKK